ncbi:putative glycolipid-binding domain-containing protein [Gordonia zhaorongruii]|uniref:putative glycolipid-binding domain-containing protein n=1 Tax=Gordonia zhaorongruii TaxID=2597659 RepID=UPI001F37DC82|nr:putative glycolipid-binding domain-containing protein [Gordonia zhaorongruii]
MTFSDTARDAGAKTMFTWQSVDGGRLEQVRLNTGGGRLRAYGRIISAATDDVEAYSASYELVTNDIGVTRRLSVRLLRAGGEGHYDVSRDMDGRWMVQTPDSTVHSDFDGAEAVDVLQSPFFKTLPINRHKLVGGGRKDDIPLVGLVFPAFDAKTLHASYSIEDGQVRVTSERGDDAFSVDSAGMVVDYAGVATRV